MLFRKSAFVPMELQANQKPKELTKNAKNFLVFHRSFCDFSWGLWSFSQTHTGYFVHVLSSFILKRIVRGNKQREGEGKFYQLKSPRVIQKE